MGSASAAHGLHGLRAVARKRELCRLSYILRGRPKRVASQVPELRQRKLASPHLIAPVITPVDATVTATRAQGSHDILLPWPRSLQSLLRVTLSAPVQLVPCLRPQG